MTITRRHAAFVKAFIETWNASEAARRSGYKGKRPDQAGYEFLRIPEIAAAVAEAMRQVQMESDEVLARMAQQARANVSTFFYEDGSLNWEQVQAQGYLVKRLKTRTTRRTNERGAETETTEYDVELHDAQNALIKIGEARRIFGSRSAIEEAAANGSLESNITVYLPDNGRPRRETASND